ncbi:MAG: hypothetical protein GXO65_01120 [Euryarchaeota archaeon]|nr:hypothetical protein [Euryarchaeota archaeon]
MKNLGSTAIGALGGLFLGFGLGFRYATWKMADFIPRLSTDVAVGLKPEYDLMGQLIGKGISMGLESYAYQHVLNPLPVMALGLVAIAAGLLAAQRQGQGSWV